MIGTILFVVFFLFIVGIIIVLTLIRRVLHATGLDQLLHLFRQQGRRGQGTSRPAGSPRPDQPRHTATAHGDTIIDRRNPEEASQKIFRRDEGEYVDYEEE